MAFAVTACNKEKWKMRFAIYEARLKRDFCGQSFEKESPLPILHKRHQKVHQQSNSKDCLAFPQLIILLKVCII
jgi:hypothetical protein